MCAVRSNQTRAHSGTPNPTQVTVTMTTTTTTGAKHSIITAEIYSHMFIILNVYNRHTHVTLLDDNH